MVNAVLYIVFNRPDLVELSLAIIRNAKPKRLYVAADGPRPNKPDDVRLCADVRFIIEKEVDWDCELYTRYLEHNLGCGRAVSSALDWFFEHEEAGIILEDDCLADPTFFPFCEELLVRYRNDKQIFQIAGSNWQKGIKRGRADYYFSHISSVWGWATWKDRWKKYQFQISMGDEQWNQVCKNLNKIASSEREKHFHLNCFTKTATGEIDTWDYQWRYTMMNDMALNIIPNTNLVSNIGHRPDGTHTIHKDHWRANLPTKGITFPLSHPKRIKADHQADRFLAKAIWVSSSSTSIVFRLKSVLRKFWRKIR